MTIAQTLARMRHRGLNEFGFRKLATNKPSALSWRVLRALGVRYVSPARLRLRWTLLVIAAAAFLRDIIYFADVSTDTAAKIATLFVAVIASTTALLQWSSVRHENTIEKYYDRVNLINGIVDAYHKDELKEDQKLKRSHYMNMLAFTELLTLEYVIVKFELGYANISTLNRAVLSFHNRMVQTEFKVSVLHWLENTDPTIKTSYRYSTRSAAEAILEVVI